MAAISRRYGVIPEELGTQEKDPKDGKFKVVAPAKPVETQGELLESEDES